VSCTGRDLVVARYAKIQAAAIGRFLVCGTVYDGELKLRPAIPCQISPRTWRSRSVCTERDILQRYALALVDLLHAVHSGPRGLLRGHSSR